MENLAVVILAAGLGTRMKSARAKVLHPLLGRPLIAWPLAAARALNPVKIIVVVGHQAAEVEAACRAFEAADSADTAGKIARCNFALQKEQRGTGDALACALPLLDGHAGPLLILAGDVPHLTVNSLNNGATLFKTSHAAALIFSAEVENPAGYGRVVRDEEGQWAGMVEDKDATSEQRRLREVNSGIYFIAAPALAAALPRLQPDNAQKELYLTDVFALIKKDGGRVALCQLGDAGEILGINDRAQLATAARRRQAAKNRALMLAGVTLLDPDSTWIDEGVEIGADSVIHPGVQLQGATRIGANCLVRGGSVIRDSVVGDFTQVKEYCVLDGAQIGRDCRIGPFAHLRPESELMDEAHVGNFVETKKSVIGRGSKANHLSYIGDATVGDGVNIGAGVITCNYDGVDKHRTTIEDGVFVGSDTAIVAPRTLGAGSVIGAGSVVRQDVPPDTLFVTMGEKKSVANHPVVRAIKAKRNGKPAK